MIDFKLFSSLNKFNKYINKVDIFANYKNSNYQKKIKTISQEVLITNYPISLKTNFEIF